MQRFENKSYGNEVLSRAAFKRASKLSIASKKVEKAKRKASQNAYRLAIGLPPV